MQLLKSLFCLQGYDNRNRFFVICAVIYITFIMLASAFSGKLFISFTLLIFFSVILALTSLRRLHDAKLSKNWLFAPSFTFALAAAAIIYSPLQSSYYLLIIPVLCSSVLLTYKSKLNVKNTQKRSYTLGYIGPVDLSEFQKTTYQGKSAKFRIEPTLAGKSSINFDNEEQVISRTHQAIDSDSSNKSNQADIGEIIRLKLVGNKKAQLAITAAVSVTVLSVIIAWLTTYIDSDTSPKINKVVNETSTKPVISITRKHPLAMPDNFTLFLSEHQGVIINWQVDKVNTAEIWSQQSAKGDKSCQSITFNKGKSIRTLHVQIENNSDYFANFSPLDSKAIIQALAFKNSFSLCGYNFSLKGTQAILGKHKHYAGWIDY